MKAARILAAALFAVAVFYLLGAFILWRLDWIEPGEWDMGGRLIFVLFLGYFAFCGAGLGLVFSKRR